MPNPTLKPEVPYKAFSGANIYATIGNRKVGTLQALTVSVTREVAALYSFSDANPKAFVKGKRGIAGTLVFTQFDRHALLGDIFRDAFNKTLRDSGKLNVFSSRFLNTLPDQEREAVLNGTRTPSRNFLEGNQIVQNADASFGTQVSNEITNQLLSVYELVANQRLRYPDQIPEFDITLTMVNEAGDAAFCVIGGIQLVNEGWGYTLDDLVSEVAYTYVARSITPLTSLTNPDLWKAGRFGRDAFDFSG